MSFEASKVARTYDFPKFDGVSQSTMRAVFVELCWYANDETKEAFPTIETLTKKLYLTKRAIMGSLKALKELGYIQDTGKRTGKQARIVVYRVNLEHHSKIQ